jgi:hypothetical protein
MDCSIWGKQLRREAKFCSACGTAALTAVPIPEMDSAGDATTEPQHALTTRPSGCLRFVGRLFDRPSDYATRDVMSEAPLPRSTPVMLPQSAAQTFPPRHASPPMRPRYRLRDDFLSRAEASFMRVLQQALGKAYLLCPKVNLGDLFYAPHDQAAWNRINRKHVDFLVCDPDKLRPLLGIELDDRSHQRPDRQERDDLVNAVFDTAGLPLLRMPVRSRYVLADVEEVSVVLSQAID